MRQREEFCLPNFLPAGEEYGYSLDEEKAHEAGYDSFICGVCFVGMAKKVGVPLGEQFEKSAVLRPFLNRIFVMGVMDVKAMYVAGKDAAPHRDHVFHVTVPATWRRLDITNRFKDFGGCQVYRLTDTTAFIGLNQRDCAAAAWKALHTAPDLTLKRYVDFARDVAAGPGQESPLTAVKRRPVDSPAVSNVGAKKLKKEEQFPTDDNWTK